MASLNLSMFTSGNQDLEWRQYQIQQGLKEAYDEFSRNRLYPTLRDLIDLHNAVADLLQKLDDMEEHLPRSLKEVNLVEGKLVYDSLPHGGTDMDDLATLITWAIPLLKHAIEEGMEIYNFVDEHVSIDQVGILPVYLEEGYWFVPDKKLSFLYLLRYEVSLFSSTTERYRALKTRILESIEEPRLHRSPESYKHGLMERYPDLPNPATFLSETDIDFPFQETMLPVAKRKLMARVFS
ncbi:MAG TPA: hypothetical protein VGB89_09445 [Bacteroidota bacterium]